MKAYADYKLPSEPTPAREELSDFLLLIHGEKKIGKTAIASMFPDVFFLFFEPGGRGLSLTGETIVSWDHFLAISKALVKSKRFKTVVVDTVDEMFKMCDAWSRKRLGIEHPSDLEWGKGWSFVEDQFRNAMFGLQRMGRGLVLVSHTEEKEVKRRNGTSYTRIQSSCPGAARRYVDATADVWMYAHFDGDRRVLQIVGDELVSAGHRLEGHFNYTDGEPMTEIPMGRNRAEAYKNLVAAFENRFTNPAAKAAKKKG